MPVGHHGRLWTLSGHRIMHDTGLQTARELTLTLQLKEKSGFVVVPYSAEPGSEAPFVLRTFSSVAVEMTQVRLPLNLCQDCVH